MFKPTCTDQNSWQYLCCLLGTRLVEVPPKDGPDVPDLAIGRHLFGIYAIFPRAAAGRAGRNVQLRAICVLLHEHSTLSVRASNEKGSQEISRNARDA